MVIRRRKQPARVLGLVVSAIALSGCIVWYAVVRHSQTLAASAFGDLTKLSNAEIRRRVSGLAARMRTLQVGPEKAIADETSPASRGQYDVVQLRDMAKAEYRANLWPEARALHEELKRRLAISKEDVGGDVSLLSGLVALNEGMLAGAYPLSSAANYLESLSRRLPE